MSNEAAKPKFLGKDEILSAQDLGTEVVDIPEWGGQVLIRRMTASDRDSFEASLFEQKKDGGEVTIKNLRARLCRLSLVDEAGNLLFSEKEVEALGKKSAKALDRIFSAAQKINGIGEKDVDSLVKN